MSPAEAITLEHALRDVRELTANLTATQERCSELLTECRAMKIAAASLTVPEEWSKAMAKAKRELEGR